MRLFLAHFVCAAFAGVSWAADAEVVWPEFAPGETTRSRGNLLPYRPQDDPPITRIEKITQPTFSVHLADHPNGTGAVILPGGGFRKVVPDKEGSEAAQWLNRLGVSAFVLNYRTTDVAESPGWTKPLQDAQRTLAIVRARADEWGLDRQRIGLVGFSAGGQVAARLLCGDGELSYDAVDESDRVSHWPNFSMLIYPWQIYDEQNDRLIENMQVPENCPPTFLVHTGDDQSSSLGPVLFYKQLKRRGIPAELHVYGNGGHGYGLRPVDGSQISTWPNHAAHWLQTQGFAEASR